MIALSNLGVPIIFFIVWGDAMGGLIDKINPGTFWSSRVFTQGLLGVLLVVLAIQKDISRLKFAGFAILACVATFILLFFIHAMISDPDPEQEADHLETSLSWRFFSSLPTIITINTFQSSFFTAFAALKNKTKRNGQLADGSGRIVMFLTYISSPLIAFVLYGKKIKSNLLLNIAKDTGVIPVILMFLFMVISALTIPIVFFVGKESVLIVFDEITRGSYSGKLQKKKEAKKRDLHLPVPNPEHHHTIEMTHHDDHHAEHHDDHHEEHHDEHLSIHRASHVDGIHDPSSMEKQEDYIPNPKEYLNMKRVYFYVITLTLWVMVTILSIVVGDVSVFFGVIGAIAGCYFMFTGPGLFYVVVTHKKKVGFPTAWSKVKYAFAWMYLWVGAFLMVSLCM